MAVLLIIIVENKAKLNLEETKNFYFIPLISPKKREMNIFFKIIKLFI